MGVGVGKKSLPKSTHANLFYRGFNKEYLIKYSVEKHKRISDCKNMHTYQKGGGDLKYEP